MDKPLILILEDTNLVRRHILEILEDLNADFLEAISAPGAVQTIVRYCPKVAILDIQVPGNAEIRNGIDVLRWAHVNYPEIAVIIISNDSYPQYRKACTALGAVHFFDKSNEFEQLHDAVKVLLETS